MVSRGKGGYGIRPFPWSGVYIDSGRKNKEGVLRDRAAAAVCGYCTGTLGDTHRAKGGAG